MKKHNNSVKLGEYPKWIAKIVKWAIDTKKPKGVLIKLYGRGKGSNKGQRNYGALPLKFCKRAVIYVYFVDEGIKSQREWSDKQYKKIVDLEYQLEQAKGV